MSAALLILGVGAGATNAAGTWCLFRALERGAPAALAIPLTALYPLITVALAVIVLHEAVTAREVVGAVLAI
ncbi:EamA family transporter, partial [Acinetobacter baumannii]